MIHPEKFAAGMKLQLARFKKASDEGMTRRGWKVAINVPEVLQHLDLPHSGVGWIDGHHVLASGESFKSPADAKLLIEPEVAIHIAVNVSSSSDANAARKCIGGLSPALEIVNYSDAGAGFDEIVAASMFHAASVVGAVSSLDRASELGSRWPVLHVDDTRAEDPREDLVPADLGEVVAFVAAYLSEFGEGLEAGDLILSGSYTAKALPILPGQEAIADYGPLGRVSVTIAD